MQNRGSDATEALKANQQPRSFPAVNIRTQHGQTRSVPLVDPFCAPKWNSYGILEHTARNITQIGETSGGISVLNETGNKLFPLDVTIMFHCVIEHWTAMCDKVQQCPGIVIDTPRIFVDTED